MTDDDTYKHHMLNCKKYNKLIKNEHPILNYREM